METLFAFLLKASAGIFLFYLVYWLFLRKETFYNANRWFLILALICSVVLPLFSVQYIVLVEPEKSTTFVEVLSNTFNNIQHNNYEILEDKSFSWTFGILLAYLTGAVIFLIRLLTQTFILIYLMVKNGVKSINGIRIVENEKYGLPFSFFNVVFINPKFHKQDDLPEILAHEKVHIRENHWFDLLLIELLTVIFWFNPFIWFFERAIKQNHEYLADKGVILQGHNVGRYQAILLNQLMGMQIIGVTNNLNFALNTNRLKMMTKKKTSAIERLKFVWTLPIVALLLFAFAEPDYHVKVTESESSISAINKGEKELTINGKVIREENGDPLPGASIIIKGTTSGTVSDINGEFTLVDPNPKVDIETGALSSRIVVSYVGLKTVENVVVASGKAIDKAKFTFKMADVVILIDTDIPPPPPPPESKAKIEELALPLPPPLPPYPKEVEVPLPPPSKGEKVVFFVVEDMPKFPGGSDALSKYIQYKTKEYNLEGKAKIGFTVNEKGKVTDIKIVDNDSDKIGKAAVEIIDKLPDWKPGAQRGKAVPVKYIIAVEFK